MRLRFTKMQGLGNDFVMLDGVSQKLNITRTQVRKLADRHFGIGCDQVLIVEPPQTQDADLRYRIFNADGDEVENCGNGARCFAKYAQMRELCVKNTIVAETLGGNLVLEVNADKTVTVNMGAPKFEPSEIPFNAAERALSYPLRLDDRSLTIAAVSMGNPHSVHIVDELDDYPVEEIGGLIERHPDFPNRTNAGFLQIISPSHAKLRVFERGVGETLACGTGACAAHVSAHLLGLLRSESKISLPGGDLNISWQGEAQPVFMTGPAELSFTGQISV